MPQLSRKVVKRRQKIEVVFQNKKVKHNDEEVQNSFLDEIVSTLIKSIVELVEINRLEISRDETIKSKIDCKDDTSKSNLKMLNVYLKRLRKNKLVYQLVEVIQRLTTFKLLEEDMESALKIINIKTNFTGYAFNIVDGIAFAKLIT